MAKIIKVSRNSSSCHRSINLQVTSAGKEQSQLSEWILLSANPEILRLPNLVEKAVPITLKGQPVLWTDSYSNLFQVWSVPGH